MELLSKSGDDELIFKRFDDRGSVFVAVNLTGAAKQVTIGAGAAGTSFTDILKLPGVAVPPTVSDASGRLTVTLPAKRAVVLKPQ